MSSRPGFGSGAPVQPASLEEITDSPLWHLYEYDLTHQTFTLMRIEQSLYREASFLDSRILEHACPSVRYELQHMEQMFGAVGADRGPLGFIFHIGHCGSTLISRGLASSRRVLPLREPMTLRSLSADQRELGTAMSFLAAQDWTAMLQFIVSSLARRFEPDQVNIVKATSTGNNLIAPLLDQHEGHRALLLYIPLEAYLATMLGKKKEGGDLWSQARTRMKDWMDIDPQPGFALHELQAPHLATLSWLTSMSHMLGALESHGDRVVLVDFEEVLNDPAAYLPEIAAMFGADSETEVILEQFPDIASAYSKRPDKRYTPEIRAQLLQHTRDQHGADISLGLEWARLRISGVPRLAPLDEFLA